MSLLALETSTEACSVAVLNSAGQVAQKTVLAPRRHAALILDMIDTCLAELSLSRQALRAVAFGQGPGTFIGVRTAAAVAQGLCFGLDIPGIPLSTLQGIAQAAYQTRGWRRVLVLTDARLSQIYAGAYALDAQGLMMPVEVGLAQATDVGTISVEPTFANAEPMQADQLIAPEALCLPLAWRHDHCHDRHDTLGRDSCRESLPGSYEEAKQSSAPSERGRITISPLLSSHHLRSSGNACTLGQFEKDCAAQETDPLIWYGAGNGWANYKAQLPENIIQCCRAFEPECYPEASALLILAHAKWIKGEVVEPDAMGPVYFRDPL